MKLPYWSSPYGRRTPDRCRWFVAWVVVLLSLAEVEAGEPVAGWQPRGTRELFASLIMTALAPAGPGQAGPFADFTRPFSIDVTMREGATLVAEISCDRLMEPSRQEAKLLAGQQFTFTPAIVWKTASLNAATEPRLEIVTFRLRDSSGQELHRTDRVVTLHALRECVLSLPGERADDIRLTTSLVAAYVNEHHRLIDSILEEAARKRGWGRFPNSRPPIWHPSAPAPTWQDVEADVASIWALIREEAVQYSSLARVSAPVDNVRSQNIRFLDEALSSRQANCIDGSVLFASIFLRLGLKTRLYIFPRHCMVSVELEAGREMLIETTDLQRDVPDATVMRELQGESEEEQYARSLRKPLSAAGRPRFFADGFSTNIKDDVRYNVLCLRQAAATARDQYEKVKTRFQGGLAGYHVVDVNAARAAGIPPLQPLRQWKVSAEKPFR